MSEMSEWIQSGAIVISMLGFIIHSIWINRADTKINKHDELMEKLTELMGKLIKENRR